MPGGAHGGCKADDVAVTVEELMGAVGSLANAKLNTRQISEAPSKWRDLMSNPRKTVNQIT